MMTGNGRYEEGSLLRWQTSALLALQEAAEAYLVHLFEDACVIPRSKQAPWVTEILLHSGTSVLYTPNV